MEALLALRQGVAPLGATEALITNSVGTLVEGAYSSLMVWEGENELAITPRSLPRIPSVSEDILRDLASNQGIRVVERALRREDLEGKETWIVSALHGIRLVDSIIDGPAVSAMPERRDSWQELWWQSRKPLT